MIMQIIVGAIALAFIVLVVFLIRTLVSLRKTLKKVDRVLQDAHKSLETVPELIHTANKLTSDIRKKSEGLDVLFRPLYAMKRESSHERNSHDKVAELIDVITDGIRLFIKVKDEIGDYVKSK